jgi:hypothetical protein
LAAMTSIHAKIRVGREKDRVGRQFADPDEAGVRETHRKVGIVKRSFATVFFDRSNPAFLK